MHLAAPFEVAGIDEGFAETSRAAKIATAITLGSSKPSSRMRAFTPRKGVRSRAGPPPTGTA